MISDGQMYWNELNRCCLSTVSLFVLFVTDSERSCTGRVASFPQLVSSSGNTPGQHWRLQEGKDPLTSTKSTGLCCLFLRSDYFSNLVPAGCRDIVRVLGQTKFQSGPEVSSRQEQSWGPVGTGGTTILKNVLMWLVLFWRVLKSIETLLLDCKMN